MFVMSASLLSLVMRLVIEGGCLIQQSYGKKEFLLIFFYLDWNLIEF